MDIVRLRIPYGFIRDRTQITWREILFGLQEELLDPAAPMELATEHLGKDDASDPTLIELAGLRHGEDVRPYVEKLAGDEHQETVDEVRAKWLYLVLA